MSAGGRSLLVIGGTGFFGKSMLDAFRRGLLEPRGIARVIVAARHPQALDAFPELLGAGVERIVLDVASADRLPEADIVVHAANTTDARRYAEDPAGERAAILATADNFVALAAAGNPSARIVYASSGAVYGPQPVGVAQIDEDHPLADAQDLVAYKRDYAEAKRLAERAIAMLGTGLGMRVAVARCFAFVGAYLPRDQHFAVGNFLADGIAGRPVTVSAHHPVIRSYLHADDLVEWLLAIADHATTACPVYNVGSDEAVEIADLAARVAALYGVPVRVAERAAQPVDRYVPAVARARARLGVVMTHDLEAALAATARQIAARPLAAGRNDAKHLHSSAAAI